ncbi:hypothetical protein IWX49DRAFT_603183 [Phyllosticta citricarpa]|uniref:Uncharacterized protein n=1 Tax=Phyllosticta paracitricarpa TaxID=2016321 RepID=A0ABR1MTR4_9PEZI
MAPRKTTFSINVSLPWPEATAAAPRKTTAIETNIDFPEADVGLSSPPTEEEEEVEDEAHEATSDPVGHTSPPPETENENVAISSSPLFAPFERVSRSSPPRADQSANTQLHDKITQTYNFDLRIREEEEEASGAKQEDAGDNKEEEAANVKSEQDSSSMMSLRILPSLRLRLRSVEVDHVKRRTLIYETTGCPATPYSFGDRSGGQK